MHAYQGGQRTRIWVMGGPLGSRFGSSVAIVGDLDCDMVADVLGGAPSYDTILGQDVGLVRRLSGASGASLGSLAGLVEGAALGSAVSELGDLDGDGAAEYMVGAPGAGVAAEGEVRIESSTQMCP